MSRLTHNAHTLRLTLTAALLSLCAFTLAVGAAPTAPETSDLTRAGVTRVDFSREVMPLLSAHCFECHGNGKSQGGLSLDTRAAILKGGASGPTITPGFGSKSVLIGRLLGTGGKPRMPLGFAPLRAEEINRIRLWIDQGAVWPDASKKTKHWAYVKPVRAAVPTVRFKSWIRNPIDNFVLARLEKEGLKPSPEADRITLIRRVTFDLIGLPPTTAEIDSFLADHSPNAYEKVVDRLLANQHYGERMALPWLDSARYADSNGFQQDGDTYQYVWRDWVVRAMNQNMPFDQFTIEQLAGDLLPNATVDQRVATGFNRCHLLNGEGGAIPEEQRNVILFDRVDVTATTWLASTLACAQCHDHKYDPFTQRDYYSFMSFFNNVPESGTPPGGGQYRIADPWIYAPSVEDTARIKEFDDKLATARTSATAYEHDHEAEIRQDETAWEHSVVQGANSTPIFSPWYALTPIVAASYDAAYDTAFEPEKGVDLAAGYRNGKLQWQAHPEYEDGKPYVLNGENTAFYFYRTIHSNSVAPVALSFGSDDAIEVWLDGRQIVADKALRAVAPDQDKVSVTLHAGDNHLLMKIVNGGGIGGFYFKASVGSLPPAVLAALNTAADARTAEAAKTVHDFFVANAAPAGLRQASQAIVDVQKQRSDYEMTLPKVMVMSDAQPRVTHVLDRGNYEAPRAEVASVTPAFLPSGQPDLPKNRLGLARWLVSPENPLTARVQVNRYWQLFFGMGIVKTSENLGTQCDPPSNQQLLDWLAVEFRESGWNVKAMHRLMVTSAAYRQSSKATPALLARDPENRLIARGARFRMSSLVLRDLALAVSGLLDERIGGKPVYPYQPKGIWDGLAITNERDFTYPQSKGADLYRRSIYTFWRRTVAPANMFDASVRNTCKVRLTVTSTPLHALTMLNDITWVEAGRALAQHVMQEAGPSPDARLTEAFRRVCGRRPSADEAVVLKRGFTRALDAYRKDPAAAAAYLKIGESPADKTLDPAEHAAYATVCLAILNLDEAMTRE